MHAKKFLNAAFAVAVAASFALPSNAAARSNADESGADPAQVSVRVVNGNWLDMRVFVVTRGVTYRLGTVGTGTSRTFALPKWMAASTADIQLVAAPVGSRERLTTQSIIFSPGDVIEWRLANNLSVSTVDVRVALR